jgi:hypothetical protein
MKTKLPVSREYVEFVTELKSRIQSARISAARAVNRDLILLYWDIGRGILERQAHLGWGKAVVETLAKDLTKEFPSMNSFSSDNLWRMRQLYAAYTDPGFLAQLVPETPSGKATSEILGQAVPELKCCSCGAGRCHSMSLRRTFCHNLWQKVQGLSLWADEAPNCGGCG